MSYRVLTVAREFGSGGAEIARQLASRLGWDLLDSTLVMQVAEAAKVHPELARRYDERVDSWLHRVLRRGLWSGAFESFAEPAGIRIMDAEMTTAIASGLIREAHRRGNCVIVGRGAQCVLRWQSDVFHLFIYAPLAARVERVRNRPGARADLKQWIQSMDLHRCEYVRHNFGCDWANPHLYNLMINSVIGYEAALGAVLSAMQAPREAR